MSLIQITEYEPKYKHLYDEPIKIASEVLALIGEHPAKAGLSYLLIFFTEYVQMWYKAKCIAMEYCIAQYEDSANGYAVGVAKMQDRILELMKGAHNYE